MSPNWTKRSMAVECSADISGGNMWLTKYKALEETSMELLLSSATIFLMSSGLASRRGSYKKCGTKFNINFKFLSRY